MSAILNKHSRMPRKFKPQTELKKSDLKSSVANYHKLEKADPHEILKRYLTDETTTEIASSYGVTRQGLGYFLLKNCEEDWKECQVARAIARKEKAEDDLEAADDALKLARARELLKSAQWDLERVCKRIYGQDHNFNLNVNVIDLGDRLRRARERAVEIVHVEDRSKEVPATAQTFHRTRDAAMQQYDSEAPQQQPIIPGSPVDSSA